MVFGGMAIGAGLWGKFMDMYGRKKVGYRYYSFCQASLKYGIFSTSSNVSSYCVLDFFFREFLFFVYLLLLHHWPVHLHRTMCLWLCYVQLLALVYQVEHKRMT